ncbi:MAG TPA: deoxyribonuclease IV [Thermodesulfobacteriota bacterium]|nr:deoxyribonuclease IV [Thermodesulfobacteriota bacterium]
MKFGAHVSIAGGIDKAPERAHALGCECFQIFTRSPRGGKPPALSKDLVDSFMESCSTYGLPDYYIHTPYYINLASEKKELRRSSIAIIREELERGSLIGAKYVMTHLGSSKGMDRARAVDMVTEGIASILEGSDDLSTELLLENTAGQGETIEDTFEELARILADVGHPRLGVCLDTAHLLASGYDIRNKSSLDDTLTALASMIDPGRVKLIHGNDSKAGLGEKKDRHEHIGKGKIGAEGFRAVLSSPILKKLDMIVEIPPEEVAPDLELLKRMRDKV